MSGVISCFPKSFLDLSGRYESYAGLSAAEDCGILHGCENGRCIRVAEGYTCDCYQGYELDMTSMTCIGMDHTHISTCPVQSEEGSTDQTIIIIYYY